MVPAEAWLAGADWASATVDLAMQGAVALWLTLSLFATRVYVRGRRRPPPPAGPA